MVVSASDLSALFVTRFDALGKAMQRAERAPAQRPVHKTRVEARRLRSLLGTLKPLMRRDYLERACRDLRNLALELSELRQANVRRTWLDRLACESGALERAAHRHLLAAMDRSRTEARRRYLAHTRTLAYRERYERLASTLTDPQLVQARGDLEPVVRIRLRKRWKRLQCALRALPDDTRGLHELRLAAKHVRYASEGLAPLLGLDLRHELQRLKQLQDCLGGHRDAADALEWLDRLDEPAGLGLLGGLRAPIQRSMSRRIRELARLVEKFPMPDQAAQA